MPVKKFTRYTKGLNAQVIVPKAAAVSTQATYALFVANAAIGELGIYDASLNRHTDAIVAGEEFFFCQKRTGGTWRTPLYKFAGTTKRKLTYVAPVKATGSLGWSGTGGAINAPVAIAAGRQYEFGIIETTEGNDPFPSWNFNHTVRPGQTEADVMQALAKLVNDTANVIYKANTPLVTAKVKADATYGNYAIGAGGTLTVTNKSDVITTAVGTIDIALNDFISFDAAATPTDAVGDIYKIIEVIDANNFRLSRPYTGATQTFVEAEAEGTRVKKVTAIVANGLAFTAINNGEHFRIVVREDLLYATVNNLTTFTRGNGTPDQVEELELEGWLMQGSTARNTQFGDAAYGNPDKFMISQAETYDIYTIAATFPAGLSDSMQSGTINPNVVIAAPKSAGGISAFLDTFFTNVPNP